MAEAALTCVVEKLSKLLIHHRDLISGAEIEVHRLMDDLNSLKTLFLELEKKQKDEGPFREIERQIKEVVYDVEDTIDTFSTIVRKHSRHHPGIIPFSTIIKINSRPSPNILFHVDNAIDRFIKDFLMRFGLYTRQAKKVKRLRENKVKPILEAFKATLFTLAFSYAPSTCAEQLRYSRPIKAYLKGSAAVVATKPAAACCVPLKEMVVSNSQCLCAVFNNPAVLKTLNVTQDDALNLAKTCAVNADISLCSKEAAPPASIPAAPSTNNSEASAPPKKNAGTAVSHALLPALILSFIVSRF